MSLACMFAALLVAQPYPSSQTRVAHGFDDGAAKEDRERSPVSPFNGRWTMVFHPEKESDPEILSLEHGVFSRGVSKSMISVEADGRIHSMPDDGYVDSIDVTIIDPGELRERDYFRGKLVYSVTYRLSDDGITLVKKVVDHGKPDGLPITTVITNRRVGTSGVRPSTISGTWRSVNVETTRRHLTETITLHGARFTSSAAGGVGFEAIIGGPPVPVKGDAGDARIAVRMPDERRILIDMSRRGETTVHKTMTLLPDDSTISVTARRVVDGVTTNWTLKRQ